MRALAYFPTASAVDGAPFRPRQHHRHRQPISPARQERRPQDADGARAVPPLDHRSRRPSLASSLRPAFALGVTQTRVVLGLIRRLRDRGIAVIVISHNLQLLGLGAAPQAIWTAIVLLAAVTIDTAARRSQTNR